VSHAFILHGVHDNAIRGFHRANPLLHNDLVTVHGHELLMERLEAGDDCRDLVLLWQDCASDVPCSGNLSS
jgi:hypothetical protein